MRVTPPCHLDKTNDLPSSLRRWISAFLEWVQNELEEREFRVPYPSPINGMFGENSDTDPDLWKEIDHYSEPIRCQWRAWMSFAIQPESRPSDAEMERFVDDWLEDLKRVYIRLNWDPYKQVHEYAVPWYDFAAFVQDYWISRLRLRLEWIPYHPQMFEYPVPHSDIGNLVSF